MNQKKIFVKDTSDKGELSKTYKELYTQQEENKPLKFLKMDQEGSRGRGCMYTYG